MNALRVLLLLVGVLALAAPAAAGAQDAPPLAARTVTVRGTGTVTVKPDIASITIGVDVVKTTVPDALAEANRQMTAIIRALKGQGVAEDDIQTANFSVYPVRDYNTVTNNGEPSPIVGYTVSNQLSVTIRGVTWSHGLPSEEIGAVIGAAIDAGANDIYGVTFSVSDTTAAEHDARALAVANAGERAAELAAAAGKTTGDVVAMSEGVTYVPVTGTYADSTGLGGGGGTTPILGGTVEIVIDVTVTYELT